MWQSRLSPTRSGRPPPRRRFSITLPSTAANDILILEYTHRATADATIWPAPTPAARLTEKHDQLYATSTFSGKTLWSRCTGNHTGQTVTGSGLTDSCAAIITQYRGALTGSDPLAGGDDRRRAERQSATETQAQITTHGCGCVGRAGRRQFARPRGDDCKRARRPGVLPARAERLSTGGTDTSIAHASPEMATAGPTGAFTWAQTNAASGSWAYAIRPAAFVQAELPSVVMAPHIPVHRGLW